MPKKNNRARYLKNKITQILDDQGYKITSNNFILKTDNIRSKRDAHNIAKIERVVSRENFIYKTTALAKRYMIDAKDIEINKIKPQIREVHSGSDLEKLFGWWNMIWWSLPYEKAYGRQMRFVIWDQYHNAPIGLIGLQSPILSWSVRDKYLDISPDRRDYWVNQSLSAQRLGALPPYNYILGGKLIGYLMTADVIRQKFRLKYRDKKTILKKRRLPSRLLFITTTGAYGKSSVYNRLKLENIDVAKFIGYSQGSGSFHIPNTLYEDMISYLDQQGYNVQRGYGNGPSRKLRLLDQALKLLGFENGVKHGIQRAVYLFPLAQNLKDVIHNHSKPIWMRRDVDKMTDFWRKRWQKQINNRIRSQNFLNFTKKNFIKETLQDLKKYKSLSN